MAVTLTPTISITLSLSLNMNKSAMKFNEKLKACREKCGMTQDEVAKHIVVGRCTYTRYERGDYEPDLATTLKLARLFGVTTDWLIDPDEPYECAKPGRRSKNNNEQPEG